MKKKLLFVIPSLDAGGAEKSLINLLSQFDFQQYEIDLFLFNISGLFLNSLPKEVVVLAHTNSFKTFKKGIFKSGLRYLRVLNFSLFVSRMQFFLINRIYVNKVVSEQKSWKYIAKSMTVLDKQYDAAIGYLEKSSLYFVIDKVQASSKIGWIHTNYASSGMDAQFDLCYFNKLNHLITVSDECVKSLNSFFPAISNKISVIENIISPKIVKKLAQLEKEIEFDNHYTNILTIARLSSEKGIDLAVEACLILAKCRNTKIKWYIIGDGSERANLEQKIKEYHLEDSVLLLGLKENPYPYLEQCDIYIQPSRYEGKSIAVDEAKILNKPIIVTNFSTAKDQIKNGENGLIIDMNPEIIANSIVQLRANKSLMEMFALNLSNEKLGTEDEVNKLLELIDG